MTSLEIAAKLACLDIYTPIDHTYIQKIYTYKEAVCGIADIDGITYIVMQGTENREGWETDFDINPEHHCILGDLHGGFYEDAFNILLKVLPDLKRKTPVIVTGHSKGAAEAVILSALLKLNNINNITNILFACPNIGKKEFADWLSKNISGVSYRNAPYCFKYIGDPIPLVPPSPFCAPYQHTTIFSPPNGIIKKFLPTRWHDAQLYYSYFSL